MALLNPAQSDKIGERMRVETFAAPQALELPWDKFNPPYIPQQPPQTTLKLAKTLDETSSKWRTTTERHLAR